MTEQQPSPAERLTAAYNRMMERIRELMEDTEDKGIPTLEEGIKQAGNKAVELGEITREEAEKLGGWIKRDMEEATQYLASGGREFAAWLKFDIEQVEKRVLDVLLSVADRTKLELEAFERSMQVLARQLAATATDVAALPTGGLRDAARAWLAGLLRPSEGADAAAEAAMGELARRLDAEVRRATDELIALHGLEGRAAAEILGRMGAAYTVDKAADPARASLVGAALSGALGGLAADLAAGGLTFGAGALIGGLLGAAGARGIASAYNLARGSDASTVRWSHGFLTGRVAAAVLRYLAVAHFGRGRGDFVAGEYPEHWAALVEEMVAVHRARLAELWSGAARGDPPAMLSAQLRAPLEAIVEGVLGRLYPPRPSPGGGSVR